MAEFGISGASVFVVFLVRSFWTGLRSARRGDDIAILLVLVGLAFCMMAAPQDVFYQRTFWLAAGLTAAALSPRRSIL
jgi:hypothetical protein